MSVATLNKVNQGINSISKQFQNLPYGGGMSISALKQLILITTDKESVKITNHIISDLKIFLNDLPKEDKGVKLSDLNKNLEKTNNNIHFIEEILDDVYQFIYIQGAKIKVDDANMKTFLSNLKIMKEGLQYCSDYLKLVAEIHKSKKEIKENKTVEYTLEELLQTIGNNGSGLSKITHSSAA